MALARLLALHERRQDSLHEEHGSAAEVAEQVERWGGHLVGPADGMQQAGQRDVVDVVAGHLRQRAVLAPPCHPSVDHTGIDGRDIIGTETEAFGDAGTEAFDDDIGPGDQIHDRLFVRGIFQVRLDHRAVAQELVGDLSLFGKLAGALDPHDVCAQISQHHRCVRPGADACELDHAYSAQRSVLCHVSHLIVEWSTTHATRRAQSVTSKYCRVPSKPGPERMLGRQSPSGRSGNGLPLSE